MVQGIPEQTKQSLCQEFLNRAALNQQFALVVALQIEKSRIIFLINILVTGS